MLRQIGFTVRKNEVHGLIFELGVKNSLKLPPNRFGANIGLFLTVKNSLHLAPKLVHEPHFF